MFYKFNTENKKGAIKIKPNLEYNTLSVIGIDSSLMKNCVFKIVSGNNWFDLIRFDDSLNFAISKLLKELLENNAVTGWSCFPIEIHDCEREYYVFQNTSKAGAILNLEALNNYETENIDFDVSTWDSSDIFNLDKTLLNVCTERVKNILEKAKIRNIEFRPL